MSMARTSGPRTSPTMIRSAFSRHPSLDQVHLSGDAAVGQPLAAAGTHLDRMHPVVAVEHLVQVQLVLGLDGDHRLPGRTPGHRARSRVVLPAPCGPATTIDIRRAPPGRGSRRSSAVIMPRRPGRPGSPGPAGAAGSPPPARRTPTRSRQAGTVVQAQVQPRAGGGERALAASARDARKAISSTSSLVGVGHRRAEVWSRRRSTAPCDAPVQLDVLDPGRPPEAAADPARTASRGRGPAAGGRELDPRRVRRRWSPRCARARGQRRSAR